LVHTQNDLAAVARLAAESEHEDAALCAPTGCAYTHAYKDVAALDATRATAAADRDPLLLHCPANACHYTAAVGRAQGLQNGVAVPQYLREQDLLPCPDAGTRIHGGQRTMYV
jgi:hypothetical protein